MNATVKSIDVRHCDSDASDRSFLAAFELCPLAASVSTLREGVLIEVNSSYERHFGWSRAELIGKTALEVHFWSSGNARKKWLMAHRKSGALIGFETGWVLKDGRRIDVSISSQIVSLRGKDCILTYVQDITKRKEWEADLRISAAAFESQQAMVVTDSKLKVLKVNGAFSRLTGFSPQEAIGLTPRMFQAAMHEDGAFKEVWKTIKESGEWEGEVWGKRKNGSIYPSWVNVSAVKDRNGVATHFVSTHTDITDRKRAENQIRRLAYFDQLTGLPNRTHLYEELNRLVCRLQRSGEKFSLLIIDLDRFKYVNDSFGHDQGDRLLTHIATRLGCSMRRSDFVARLGGDEFVVLLPDISSVGRLTAIVRKIQGAVSVPFFVGHHEIRPSVSIGVSIFPNDAIRAVELMQKADMAMYQAKRQGGGGFQIFKNELQSMAMDRLVLEADLAKAIRLGQFFLVYQPQLDIVSGRIVGAEALIRWSHPQRGVLSPVDFIPLAEDVGLIGAIGEWVLEEVCRQIQRWRLEGLREFTVSVNLAAPQFLDSGFASKIKKLFAQHYISPGLICLEITESMSMSRPDEAILTMTELRDAGVAISIDDFGTGYSSMAYLSSFPVQSLKVDRSFVRGLGEDGRNSVICEVAMSLAHKLGLFVVAEGVETKEQLAFLQSIGCERAQGYFIGHPLKPDLMPSFVSSYGTA